MKSKILSLTIFISLVMFQASPAQQFTLEEAGQIGRADSDSIEYLFAGPTAITTDQSGRIYIADSRGRSIRVFNQQGTFITKFGRAGRGPGEFQSIEDVTIYNDKIYVLDRLATRIAIFDQNFEEIQTEIIRGGFTDPFAFIPFSEDDFGMIAAGITKLDNTDLLYVMNAEFDEVKGTYVSAIQDLFEKDSKFYRRLAMSPSFRTALFGDQNIAITYRNFNGKILIFNNQSKVTSSIGKVKYDAYNVMDWDKRDTYRRRNIRGMAYMSGQNGNFAYRSRYGSEGLVGNSKYLLHFHSELKDNKYRSYLDIYDKNANFLSTIDLKGSILTMFNQELGRTNLAPHHMDENNNIYIADYSNRSAGPLVRMVKLVEEE